MERDIGESGGEAVDENEVERRRDGCDETIVLRPLGGRNIRHKSSQPKTKHHLLISEVFLGEGEEARVMHLSNAGFVRGAGRKRKKKRRGNMVV
ncbi:hypothetical protein J437_LFUL007065 [Ladona fulva]|uniref:Uncharacterized protein n=1 Tax=Ladona fulva TaxID=123851 RepID=A0A8K0K5G4_LADFU|nr:hypothetical protein J437_LFUL007065 [Ladona fulva]